MNSLVVKGMEVGLSPRTFVANTATLISADERQEDDTANEWLQTPLAQKEAGMIVE